MNVEYDSYRICQESTLKLNVKLLTEERGWSVPLSYHNRSEIL